MFYPQTRLRITFPSTTICTINSLGRSSLQQASRQWHFSAPLRKSVTPKQLTAGLYRKTSGKKKGPLIADKTRVNILNEELCDNVIDRLAPSLEKNKHCDIIDINPGVGIWSSKLHDALQPRTHILMEPDKDYYLPYLQPLLDRPKSTYKLLPLSGIIWENLRKLESEDYLPHQRLIEAGDPQLEQTNDTLLLTANLGYHPARPYLGFSSVAALALHQLLTASRSNSIFHKYGKIRMLLWMCNREKRPILPRSIVARRKSAVEIELASENIFEIAGSGFVGRNRADVLELSSARAVREKMLRAGLKTPAKRMSALEKAASETEDSPDNIFGVRGSYFAELNDLEERYKRGEFYGWVDKNGTPVRYTDDERVAKIVKGRITGLRRSHTTEYDRMISLRTRVGNKTRQETRDEGILAEYDELLTRWKALQGLNSAEADQKRETIRKQLSEWRTNVEELADVYTINILRRIDDRTALQQDPPLLLWDRREYEPLAVTDFDFFPHTPLCLLDIQPSSPWPIVGGANSSNYDFVELILSKLFMLPTRSVRKGLSELAPGADDWIIPRCPSLTNIDKGGTIDPDLLSIRLLNQDMLKEIIEAFLEWPFRPSKAEMMAMVGSQPLESDLDEDGSIRI